MKASLAVLLAATLALAGCGDDSGSSGSAARAAGCPVKAGKPQRVETTLPPVVAGGRTFAFTSTTPYTLSVLDGDERRELLAEDLRTAQLLGAVDADVLVVTSTEPATTVRRMTAGGETEWEREFPGSRQVTLLDPDGVVSVAGDPSGPVYLDPGTGEETAWDPGPVGDMGLTVEGNMALLYSRTATRMEFQVDNADSVTHLVTDTDKENAWTFETSADQDLRICGDYAFVLDRTAGTLATYDVTEDDTDPERTLELDEPPLYPRLTVRAGYATYQVEGGYAVLTG